MAIFHLHVKNIGRRHGRSALAAAAYRAGETLPNEIEEGESAFGGRRDVVHTEIRLPAGAPRWCDERAQLWNAVERAEKRKDARLAKEIEFALPRELPPSVWVEAAQEFADLYVALGHVVDLAIHDDGTLRNPHAHLLLTTRSVGPNGFGGKLRAADGLKFVTEARASWAAIANKALGAIGSAATIDGRSHEQRGLSEAPGRHRGADPNERLHNRILASLERRQTAAMTQGHNREETDVAGQIAGIREQVGQLAGRAAAPTPTEWGAVLDRLDALQAQIWDENERALPVPGPEGEVLSPEELDRAQDAMIGEMEKPAPAAPVDDLDWLRAGVKDQKPPRHADDREWPRER